MKATGTIIAAMALATYASAAMAQDNLITIDPNPACQGKAVSITINPDKSTYQYAHIIFGDGTDAYATPDNNVLQHIYLEDKSYTVSGELLDNSNAKVEIPGKTVTVSSAPVLKIADDKLNSLITVTSDSEASYQWFCGGKDIQNTESSLYYYESGEYSVIATNPSGCKDEASITVKYAGANDDDDTYIKVKNNVITPAAYDGCNDVLYIEDVTEYAAPCEVKVFNKKGKLVYSNSNYTNTDGFQGKDDSGNDLMAGTYYYVIKSQGRKGCAGFVDIIR
ncbi:MAG: gliding motility-associated C-terminal domain-containing protein [Bacteroidales bacterium]|nr:gliding motility-associated C-terminal domain-containing protein [Bacteroidales bacterium]